MSYYIFQARYTAAAFKAMVENPQEREAAANAAAANYKPATG